MQKGQDSRFRQKSKIFPGERRRKIALSLVFATLVIIADQLSKSWAKSNLAPTAPLPEKGFIHLVYVENYGSAFGLFANQTFLLIVITIASLLIVLLFLHYLSPATIFNLVAIGLILGGAIGNLMNRLRFGYVIDFIDIRLWNDFHWPTFNLADAAITVGTFTLAFFLIGLFRKEKTQNYDIT